MSNHTPRFAEGQRILVRLGRGQFVCTITEVTWSEDRARFEYYAADAGAWFADAAILENVGSEWE